MPRRLAWMSASNCSPGSGYSVRQRRRKASRSSDGSVCPVTGTIRATGVPARRIRAGCRCAQTRSTNSISANGIHAASFSATASYKPRWSFIGGHLTMHSIRKGALDCWRHARERGNPRSRFGLRECRSERQISRFSFRASTAGFPETFFLARIRRFFDESQTVTPAATDQAGRYLGSQQSVSR
jgi:hypothetical protein